MNEDPSASASPSQALGNSKAASTPGNGGSKNEAGKKRGRKPKPLSTQSNNITSYMTPVAKGERPKVSTLGKKADKRSRVPDSDDEVDENVENKSAKIHVSPTNEEAEAYNALARTMHKAGRIDKEKAVTLNKQLLKSLEKEKKYYKEVKSAINAGEQGPSTPSFKLKCVTFSVEQWRLRNKLSDLADTEAKAVDHVTPDTTLEDDTTITCSSEDTDVFTDEGAE